MADKVEKGKKPKAKPKKDEQGVLASLPSTRPERIGTRRASAPKTFEEPQAAQAAAPRAAGPAAASKSSPAGRTSAVKGAATSKSSAAGRTSAVKGAAKAKPNGRAKTSAAKKPATPRVSAARRKAAAPRTFEPTPAAEAAAGGADERAAGAVPRAASPQTRAATPRVAPDAGPRAVREGAPGMGTITDREEPPSSEHGRPSGAELVTTAVQAAGELTKIGVTIGGQILKRAVGRLPRP